jgi:hypothetical protein
MEQVPLLVQFSSKKLPLATIEENKQIEYNPETQTSVYLMGGPSTSCHKVTNGTQPKNEADRIMDDN